MHRHGAHLRSRITRPASSVSTSARFPAARWSCGPATAPNSAPRSASTRTRVIERTLPATGERLRPAWALQDPEDYREVLRVAVPAARRARPGWTPAAIVGIATDFTASTPMPVLRDGTPLCEVDGLPRAPARLSEAVEAPRRPGPGRARHARWRPSAARRGWRATAGASPPSGSSPRRCRSSTRTPEVYEAIERWIEAADWIVWELCGRETRNVCTAGYKGIHQDGAYPSRATTCAALDERFAGFVADKLEHPLSAARRPRRRADRTRGGLDRAPRGHRRRDRQRRRARHRTGRAGDRRPGQMVAIMGTSTCHVMNHSTAGRGARACAAWSRAGSRPACGATRPGRAASATSSAGSSSSSCRRLPPTPRSRSGLDLHEYLSALAGAQARRRARAARARLAQRQPLRARRPRAQRRARRPHAAHAAGGHLPRADRGDRVRRAHDRRDVRGRGRAVEDFVVAGGLLKNPFVMQIYADVLRRPLHLIGSEQGPALGSAIHAAVAAGLLPRHPRRVGGDGARRSATPTCPTRGRRTPTTTLYASYVAPARPLRPRRRRRHAPPAAPADAGSGRADARRACGATSGACTPSSRATGSWPGRAATSPRACPTPS